MSKEEIGHFDTTRKEDKTRQDTVQSPQREIMRPSPGITSA